MSSILVGRKEEHEILLAALASGQSEMVAVFGRRRVGKTYLIKQTYQEHIAFELTGLQNSDNAGQLQNFSIQLNTFSKSRAALKIPPDWMEAFSMLANFLDKQPKRKKKTGRIF